VTAQAACWQVGQVQSAQVQFPQESEQEPHWHWAWLQVGHVQSWQSHSAHASEQWSHEQVSHSS
jgi:hypothetical protein